MHTKVVELAGKQLIGEWHYAKPQDKSLLIILCHGYQSSQEDPTIVAIVKGFNNYGYDTFTFNFSANKGGVDVRHQVGDIGHIVEYFKGYRHIVLLAGSFGALTAAIATIKMPEIAGLITINGFFGQRQLGKELRRPYIKFRIAALAVPSYRKTWVYFKHNLRPDLIRVPTLVIHSKVDKHVFIQQSRDFYGKLRAPKRFIELHAANHGIASASDRQKLVSEIHAWLLSSLSTE